MRRPAGCVKGIRYRTVHRMTRERLLDLFKNLQVWKRHGVRAPHKPLLLLLALGRVLNNKDRLVSYSEIEVPMKELLRRFGPPRGSFRPEYPFSRLPRDQLWDIPGSENLFRIPGREYRVRDLKERDVKGGFPVWVYDFLRRHSDIARDAAQGLLDAHFPESLHDEIRAATGIPYTWEVRETPKRRRDPAFRRHVLREYQYRCAVCNFDVRLGDDLIGLEAAHIMWVASRRAGQGSKWTGPMWAAPQGIGPWRGRPESRRRELQGAYIKRSPWSKRTSSMVSGFPGEVSPCPSEPSGTPPTRVCALAL